MSKSYEYTLFYKDKGCTIICGDDIEEVEGIMREIKKSHKTPKSIQYREYREDPK
jgi:hypothetical protein